MFRKVLLAVAVVGLVGASTLVSGAAASVSENGACACCEVCVCDDCICDIVGCACDSGGDCGCTAECCLTCCDS